MSWCKTYWQREETQKKKIICNESYRCWQPRWNLWVLKSQLILQVTIACQVCIHADRKNGSCTSSRHWHRKCQTGSAGWWQHFGVQTCLISWGNVHWVGQQIVTCDTYRHIKIYTKCCYKHVTYDMLMDATKYFSQHLYLSWFHCYLISDFLFSFFFCSKVFCCKFN